MKHLKEKVAYLQGLTRGLEIDDTSKEGKVLANIVNVLDDFAKAVDSIHVAQEELENYVECLDEDLADLEGEVYEEDPDIDFVEVECPECHEVVQFEEELLHDDDPVEVTCPNCGHTVYENTLDIESLPSDAIHRQGGHHPGI